MKPELPKYIDVGCHRYTISTNVDAYNKKRPKNKPAVDKDCFGLSDHRTTEIVIKPDQSFSNSQDTLWHEVKHCAWRYLTWDTPKNMSEEDIIYRSCAPELDALRRNPDLVKYLLAEDNEDAE